MASASASTSTNPKDFVTETALEALFRIADRRRYAPGVPDKDNERIIYYCVMLFKKDYCCKVLENLAGRSAHYSTKLVVPVKKNKVVYEKNTFDDRSLSFFNDEDYKKRVEVSQGFRNNKRFPVPTIFFKEKFLLRSGEITENSVAQLTEYYLRKEGILPKDFIFQINIATAAFLEGNIKFYFQMKKDVAILRQFDVKYICDLRIRDPSRDHPRFLHCNRICKQHYRAFKTVHLPYPAISFFREYHRSQNLKIRYNWNTIYPRFDLTLPDLDYMTLFQVDFTKFQEWHVLDLTLNYLLVLQTYITSDSLPERGGVLLHCDAGQDQTPVFLTLLRLSLWADGLIHEFLTPNEILFLTIAYDWYLFGHNVGENLDHNYEIMHFCFSVLEHIACDRFSVRKSEKTGGIACSQSPPGENERKKKLKEVMEQFRSFYAMIQQKRSEPPPYKSSKGR